MEERATVRRASILVVDDEQLIRWSLQQRLEQAGYDVVVASSAQQTRENLGDGTDLVLLDLKLPDASGFDVLREILGKRPNCRIVLMTAHRTPEIVREALRHGARDVVQKPFRLDDIARTVADALR